MHHSEHDGLTEYEQWVVEELVKYGTEGTEHLAKECFEQQWHFNEKASISASKLFYSSLFNNPKDARWAIDRILEIPYEYQIDSLLHLGYSLAIFYENMVKEDPSLDKLMRNTYQKWIDGLEEEDGL